MKCLNCIFYPCHEPEENCKEFIPLSNADKIRRMRDEELAVFLANVDGDFPPHVERCSIDLSAHYWLEWLKQEATEEEF
jgi:chromosome condensin MukBEF complex kleisin-like MukF subunit